MSKRIGWVVQKRLGVNCGWVTVRWTVADTRPEAIMKFNNAFGMDSFQKMKGDFARTVPVGVEEE